MQKQKKKINKNLSAKSLKEELWDTLNSIKAGTIDAGSADAVASQAREIVRTVRVQLMISGMSGRAIPKELINFNEKL